MYTCLYLLIQMFDVYFTYYNIVAFEKCFKYFPHQICKINFFFLEVIITVREVFVKMEFNFIICLCFQFIATFLFSIISFNYSISIKSRKIIDIYFNNNSIIYLFGNYYYEWKINLRVLREYRSTWKNKLFVLLCTFCSFSFFCANKNVESRMLYIEEKRE